MIYQQKPYFITDGKNNINQAIKLYTSGFNEGDDIILIENKEVYFSYSNVVRDLDKIAIQITKLYYEKKDYKNAKKWIKEAKYNHEMVSDIIHPIQTKLKISRDYDAFERRDIQNYGEILFYYALVENHALSEKLKLLWHSFQLLLDEKDIVIVEMLNIYNNFFDEILELKINVRKELLDQFKNRLKFYLDPKNELQFELDFQIPQLKPKVLEYFDIINSKKKKSMLYYL